MNDKTGAFRFLLYVSVMLIITFLQQEFILLPELQNLDLIGDEARAEVMESWHKWRWVSFLLAPLLLTIRLCLVALCLFIGGFFFAEMSGRKFKDWWGVAMRAQAVMILYSVVLCIINVTVGANSALELTRYTSLLFLGKENLEPWIKIPLASANLFEVLYWLFMAWQVGRLCRARFGKSFRFVLSSYGVGYLFYIVLLMFLTLYLS